MQTNESTTPGGAPAPLPSPSRRPTVRIDPRATVNEIMQQHPVAVTVFNTFGVDACCGGGEPLADAALDAGVELDVLLEALQDALCPGAEDAQ